MKYLLSILLIAQLYAGSPAEDWLPNQYKIEAIQYYDKLDSAQWVDVRWHADNYGIRQGVFAGLEGSNRQRGKHGDEDSFQCLGVYFQTARLYRPGSGLRDSLRSHSFVARLSFEIDSSNISGHRKRTIKGQLGWRAKRSVLNATMAYPGGKFWRNRLIYGMVHEARYRELEKRLLLRPEK